MNTIADIIDALSHPADFEFQCRDGELCISPRLPAQCEGEIAVGARQDMAPQMLVAAAAQVATGSIANGRFA